jgi:hypothetical protein
MGRRDSSRSDAAADAAEKLYAAPLATFTAERKRLADELKASGDIEASRAVARLGKPSVSAWVVNQLHREAREDLDALIEAGQRMRGGEMAAGRDQRAALARLHQASSELLVRDGHAASPAMLRRVTMTLQALSAIGSFDPDPPGQLVQDRDPPGFDLLAGVTIERDDDEPRKAKPGRSKTARSPRPDKHGKADKPGQKADGEPAKARKDDKAEVIDLEARRREQRDAAQRKMLEHTAAQAAKRAEARASEVAELRDDLGRAEATAERLRTALAVAQARLDEARAAADAAIKALDGMRGGK